MKKVLTALMTLGMLLGLSSGTARAAVKSHQQATRVENPATGRPAEKSTPQGTHFENRVREINTAGQKPAAFQLALKHISTETGVPLEQVRAQHQRHPELGTAGLLLANVLAAETKKAPETFINQRLSGKSWLAIAQENNVSIDKLNVRLDRVEQAIAPAAKK